MMNNVIKLMPTMQVQCFTALRNELGKFNLWTSLNGISLSNLSNDFSLIWLRILMPKLDWRIDIKFCLETWTLILLWTVDGHTWLMNLLVIWNSPTQLALLVYKLVKDLSYYAGHPEIFSPIHNLINLPTFIMVVLPSILWNKLVFRVKYSLQYLFSILCNGFYPLINTQSRIYSNRSSGRPKKDDDDNRNKKRVQLLKIMFKQANEKDEGQESDNPYIIALRCFKSNSVLDLKTLNSVLAFHKVSITQEEFNLIKSLEPVILPFPLPHNDTNVKSVIGSVTKLKQNMFTGVYVLTVKHDGRQYVGRSSNIAVRMRAYYGAKAKNSRRTVDKIMTRLGPTSFNLSVYMVPFAQFEVFAPMNEAYRAKIVLAMEQYFILHLKPVLNEMLVVGRGLTKFLRETMELSHSSTNVGSKPLYVYNADKTQHLYTEVSRIKFVTDMGISRKVVFKHLTNNTPLLGKYYFTRRPIEGRTSRLMTTDELCAAMKTLYLSSSGPRHAIKLTDLRSPEQTVRYFTSKAKARTFTLTLNRPVGKTFMVNLPCKHNGWLVEAVL